ncbi:hypothetical protein D9M72_481360 [compost metagenome]
MHGDFLAERGVLVLQNRARAALVSTANTKERRTGASADIAKHAGCQDDQREGNAEEENGDEGGGRNADHHSVLECSAANAEDSLDDHREYGGLQAEEEAFDDGDIAEGGVDVAEAEDRQETRQNKEKSGNEAAGGPVQEPADVDGELLRLGSGQQHAVVQRMQEAMLADPALLIDKDAMHHRDLSGRATEAEGRNACPNPDGFAKRDAVALPLPRHFGRGLVSNIGHLRGPSWARASCASRW